MGMGYPSMPPSLSSEPHPTRNAYHYGNLVARPIGRDPEPPKQSPYASSPAGSLKELFGLGKAAPSRPKVPKSKPDRVVIDMQQRPGSDDFSPVVSK